MKEDILLYWRKLLKECKVKTENLVLLKMAKKPLGFFFYKGLSNPNVKKPESHTFGPINMPIYGHKVLMND